LKCFSRVEGGEKGRLFGRRVGGVKVEGKIGHVVEVEY
jgi:hypothetical protein